MGWECPKCHRVYAPHVLSCSCSATVVVPVYPGPVVPFYPTWQPHPWWTLPQVTCGADNEAAK